MRSWAVLTPLAPLYEEALVAFHGGDDTCSCRVKVTRDGLDLGTQRMQCHQEKIAFLVTALTQEQEDFEEHLVRLLQLTSLQAIQWINLNHSKVDFIILRRGKGMEARE
jgi:hypothetical protein